jgi:hypothetical protein
MDLHDSKLAMNDFIHWEFEIDYVRSEALNIIKDLKKTKKFESEDLEHIINKLNLEVRTIRDFENVLKQSIGTLYELFEDYEVTIVNNEILEISFDRLILLFRYCVHVVEKFNEIFNTNLPL